MTTRSGARVVDEPLAEDNRHRARQLGNVPTRVVAGGTAASEFFADQVRRDKVLWSVGPKNNARNNPAAPEWMKSESLTTGAFRDQDVATRLVAMTATNVLTRASESSRACSLSNSSRT